MENNNHQNMGSPVYVVHFLIHLKKVIKEEYLRQEIISWAECRPENLRMSKRPDGAYRVEIDTSDESCINKINQRHDRNLLLVEDLYQVFPKLRS